jgi:stearoyl-CoA desaturase (delta-9 desaturase)
MPPPTPPDKPDYLHSLPFLTIHASCLSAFWTGVSLPSVALCVFLYWIRMFGITAGYHRYFSHASFKTSRSFQFILGVLGATALQRGPLWWASLHRHHHANSDEADDIHSPVRKGLFWAHAGWMMCRKFEETRWELVKGLARYPELVWLNRNFRTAGLGLGALVFAFGWVVETRLPSWQTTRWQMLVWGWAISTVLLYHGTFTINSLSHVWGSRRYETGDGSRNNPWLAIITLGEGWHNNHHFAPSSARMGFRWWEFDQSYYVLWLLSKLGIVWDLKQPPRSVPGERGFISPTAPAPPLRGQTPAHR